MPRKAGGKSSLEAIQKDTLENSFKLLKERLDPPADIFEAIGIFRLLVLPVGEQVYGFFAQYLEEGLRAGLSTKQVCMFMISQLPMEVDSSQGLGQRKGRRSL